MLVCMGVTKILSRESISGFYQKFF